MIRIPRLIQKGPWTPPQTAMWRIISHLTAPSYESLHVLWLEGQLEIWRRKANLAVMQNFYEAFRLGARMWNFTPATWISCLRKVRLTKALASHLTNWCFGSITKINPRRAYRVKLDCVFTLTHRHRKPHSAATDWHFCADKIVKSWKDSAPQQFSILSFIHSFIH